MKSHQFSIIKDGDSITYDREPAAVLSTLRNGRYTVTIERDKDPRSLAQNALMWMWFECITKATGTPKNDVHDYFCAKFLRKRVGLYEGSDKLDGVEGTKHLSKERMTEFLKNIQADAAIELGITLPLPEDQYFEDFYNTFK